MKKSLILLTVYWLSLIQKVDAQSHKFYFYAKDHVYYEIIHKQTFYNKNGKYNPAYMLPLTFKLNINDRLSLYNSIVLQQAQEDKPE
jgi:hypothetical protein